VPFLDGHPGARETSLIPTKNTGLSATRGTRLEISLAALRQNARRVKGAVSPGAILAVVKADAYGHGALQTAMAFADSARGFCLATVEEAIELHDGGVRGRILILGGVYGDAHQEIIRRELEPVVFSAQEVSRFAAAAGKVGKPARLHVKVDTGMARLGVDPSGLLDLVSHVRRQPGVEIAGLMTHLACAEEADPEATHAQLQRFSTCLQAIEKAGARPPFVHVANSAAALRFPGARYDAVRLGLALYGVLPSPSVPDPGIQPAMAVRTRVAHARSLAPGEPVGYGWLWRASRPSRIATLPIGYADGYSRHLGGRAQVLLRGRRVPVVGAVAMDMITVDATEVGAEVGDEVTVLGEADGDRIRAEDLASWAGTIPYEVLCAFGKRVPRVYFE